MDVTGLRLQNQHLTGDKFARTEEAIEWLGAVQAQDFAAAKWSLGIRIKNSTDQKIEDAYNRGLIIRTHIMRPTWHLVMPEDVLWMQELTSPQVKKLMGHYNRKLELTDELFQKTEKLIINSLKNENYLTRQELKKIFLKEGITTDVQRLAHIIMWAELDGIIVSGPKRGKQLTYALTRERIKKHKKLTRDEQLSGLAEKYFLSHGPAQIKDFSWWSGLSVKDATTALDFIKPKLTNETLKGKTYWLDSKSITKNESSAFLLSIFDEYTISYKDRSDMSEANDIERMITMGNTLTAVMLLNGKVVGSWKRKISSEKVVIKINPFKKLTNKDLKSFERAAHYYGEFLEIKAELLY